MTVLLLAVVLEGARLFHPVPLAKVAVTKWTHITVCGTVTLVKEEGDGDAHIRLSEGRAFIVAEFVPYHRLPLPRVGQRICIDGISRKDRTHGWWELNPAENWVPAK